MGKMLAWLLIFTLCIGQASALMDVPNNIQEQVVSNFDRSFSESDYYTELMLHKFPYMTWIENLENQSITQKLWLLTTDVLMDTQLKKDDYVDYLITLMTMVDQGTMRSLELQEQFSEKTDPNKEIREVALSFLFADDQVCWHELKNASEILFSSLDLATVNVEGALQCRVLNAATITYKSQFAILNGIIANTKISALKEAAQEVLDVYTYQYCFLMDESLKAAGSTLFTTLKSGTDFIEISDSIKKWTKENFETILRNNEGIKKFLNVDKLLVNADKFVKGLPYFSAGIQIGAALAKLVAGNQMNYGKEMRAMANVAEALKAAFDDARATASYGTITSRYHAVCDYVSIGQALCIAHLRAQYCDIHARHLFSAEENHEIYYNSVLAPMIAEYADVLEAILSDFESDTNDLTKEDAAYLVLARKPNETLYGYVDLRTGKMEIPAQFTSGDMEFGANGVAIVYDKRYRCNVINEKGQKLFEDGEIDSAMEFYNEEYLIVQKDKVHCYLYDVEGDELIQLRVPVDDAIDLKPVETVYTGTYNKRRAGYVPEQYIHLRATNAQNESTDYWLDKKGEIIYRVTGDKLLGCLAGDEAGYYYFYADEVSSRVDYISNELRYIQTKTLDVGSYIPAVAWDGDRWYARTLNHVYTNMMQVFASPGYLSGLLDVDANDGVISSGGYYYSSDGRELHASYATQPFYYRNGYIKWEAGYGDRNGNVLYPFPEGTQKSDFSIVLLDEYYIQKEGGLLGIKNLDGTVACPPTYAELRDVK